MVGLVIVSHSEKLAESVAEMITVLAPGVPIAPAGGMDDGGFGTSFEKIRQAILGVLTEDGVVVLMDLGSALMTAEMVIEMIGDSKVRMADCPLVEGAVAAAIDSAGGMDLEAILKDLERVRGAKKIEM